jgi:hypothetical protein
MKPHEQRVVDEFNELNTRIGKLDVFIHENDVFHTLPEEDQGLLTRQLDAMSEYADILGERINRFT